MNKGLEKDMLSEMEEKKDKDNFEVDDLKKALENDAD
jgi:hypothetical protein